MLSIFFDHVPKVCNLFTKLETIDCTGTSLKSFIFELGCTPFILWGTAS